MSELAYLNKEPEKIKQGVAYEHSRRGKGFSELLRVVEEGGTHINSWIGGKA